MKVIEPYTYDNPGVNLMSELSRLYGTFKRLRQEEPTKLTVSYQVGLLMRNLKNGDVTIEDFVKQEWKVSIALSDKQKYIWLD